MNSFRKLFYSRFFLSLVFIFTLSCSMVVTAQTLAYPVMEKDGVKFYQYSVESGEGVYAISKRFSISQDEILKHNPSLTDGIKKGQQILIPVKNGNSVENKEQKFTHTVSRGETLYSLASTYNISINDIYKLNPEARNGIKVGMTLIIPQKKKDVEVASKNDSFNYHTIKAKETLYSLTKIYDVSAKDIIDANPGLSDMTFQIGRVVRIPISIVTESGEIQHKVEMGETIYSISRRYDISESALIENNPSLTQGLTAGTLLSIPNSKVRSRGVTDARKERDINKMIFDKYIEKNNLDVIRVGLLLPFLDKTNNQDVRFKEYYEGFLLSIEDLKKKGANIELYTFDIGSGANVTKLNSLLETMEMQSLNLIVGGISKEQIKVLSRFADNHSIKYVIPTISRIDEVLSNGNIFQVNTPHSYLYSKASSVVLDNIDKRSNIIFVNGTSDNDKEDFISQIKTDLANGSFFYKSVVLDEDIEDNLLGVLDLEQENIIFPTLDNAKMLRTIFKTLRKIEQEHPHLNVSVVGHPSWQTFASQYLSDFYRFNVMFYSTFFVDRSPESVVLNERYNYWYEKDMYKTYPRWGALGYDTGLFFLTALYEYGVDFDKSLDKVSVKTVQSLFNFERVNNWSGFINTGIFLIKYNPNSSVTKIDFSK